MKFSAHHIELTPREADLIGSRGDRITRWSSIDRLILRTELALQAEINLEITCLEAFCRAGDSLPEALLDPTVTSLDSWDVGKMLLTLETRRQDIYDEGQV